MSIQCVSENCEHPIEDGWSFCPACGCDNRPPSQRKKVDKHYHRFLWKDQGYCLICGEPAGEPYMFGYRPRILLSLATLVLSLAMGTYALGVAMHDRMLTSPFGTWVHSWAHQLITHRSRRRYSGSYTYTTELGSDVTTWVAIGAGVALIVAIMLFLRKPFSSGEIWHESDRSWMVSRWGSDD